MRSEKGDGPKSQKGLPDPCPTPVSCSLEFLVKGSAKY